MRRLLLILIIAALGAAFAAWITASPGSAVFEFRGWVIETTAGTALFFLLAAAVLMAVLFRVIGWLFRLPRSIRERNARVRMQRGYESLERALVSAAAGDGVEARKQAQSAGKLLDRPAIARILTARSAEADGDLIEAERNYRLLLNAPETEVVGRRGLAAAAFAKGDLATASEHARAAYETRPGSRWAFETLFEAEVRQAKWEAAAATLKSGESHNHVAADTAQRRRAVLLTAQSREAEKIGETEKALTLAETAARLSPGFAPATALAARLLTAGGDAKAAGRLIEDGWRAAPHPALTLAWKDLKPEESDAARAERLRKLAALNPDHRESRIQRAEADLLDGRTMDAKNQLAPLLAREEPSARLCALVAQAEQSSGNSEAAREWINRAASAPGEADWSDLDPDGPAFDYEDADWMRLVFSYGDAGKLIHPRHERYARAIDVAPKPALEAPKPETLEGEARPLTESESPAETPPAASPEDEENADPEEEAAASASMRASRESDAPESAAPPSPDDPGPGGDRYDPREEETPRKRFWFF